MASHVTAPAAAGTAASRSMPARPGGRRPELDVMRALVVAGLVVFHSAMVFAVGTSWFVNDPRPSIGFSAFLLWGSLWGMPLLFLVSGMGVRYAMRSRAAWRFAAERLGRLGIPFATGLVLLVPPMFYLAQLAQPGFHQPYGRFWLAFLNVPAIVRGLLPHGNWTSGGDGFDPAHLWFLYVLLVFSLALLPLFRYLRGQHGTRLAGRVAGQAARHPLAMLAVAAVPVIVTEAVFGPDTSTGGWERLAYVFPFLYGFLIASDARFESALSRVRWPAVAVAAAATAGLLGWAVAAGPGVVSGAGPGWSALQGLAGWTWLAAIVGFAAAFTAPPPGRHGNTTARPGTRATVAACRRLRQPGRAAVLPAARTGHRGVCLDHRPLARAHPRQVSRPGGCILHRHTCHLRARRPPLPHHSPPVRYETPRARCGRDDRSRQAQPKGDIGLPSRSQDGSHAPSDSTQNVADICSKPISARGTGSGAESAI